MPAERSPGSSEELKEEDADAAAAGGDEAVAQVVVPAAVAAYPSDVREGGEGAAQRLLAAVEDAYFRSAQ